MYLVDDKDIVLELDDIPQSSVGAPCPIVLASERNVVLAYYLELFDPEWDGTTIRAVDQNSTTEQVATIYFNSCTSHFFGPPNDEAFSGHPLAERGLGPYGVYEILNSSWIRSLEQMNSVHPYHKKERFMDGKRHFVFSFHDSTFECVAKSFEVEISDSSLIDAAKGHINSIF